MKSPDSEKLLNFFRGLKNSDFDQREISYVVEAAVKIAISQLRLRHNRMAQILRRDELSVEDLAIDCIANLFRRDEHGRFNLLLRAFSDWKPAVSCPTEALFFLQRVTIGAVDQHLNVLLRETDPVFSKILDHVNYLVRRDGYKKLTYCGAIYIVEKNIDEISYTPAGYDEIYNMPSTIFNVNKKLLSRLMDYIVSETPFFPAIYLNALVSRLKDLNVSAFTVNASTAAFSASFEADEIVLDVLNKMEHKLNHTYLNSGKLSSEEGNGFISALQSIAHDLRDGGMNPGLYEYFKVHFPDISREEYQNRYHNMFEYLVKMMKSTLSDAVKNQR